jgi:hypothetical protein
VLTKRPLHHARSRTRWAEDEDRLLTDFDLHEFDSRRLAASGLRPP